MGDPLHPINWGEVDHTLTKKKSVTIQPKNRQMRHFFEEICSNRNFKFQLNRKNGLEVIGKFVIFLIHFTPVDGTLRKQEYSNYTEPT